MALTGRVMWALVVTLFMAVRVLAQQAVPQTSTSPPQIVRVARGSSGGGSGDSMVIELGMIRWHRTPAPDWMLKGVPEEGRTCRISKQDWEGLRRFVETKALAVFTELKGCPACVDQPDTWAGVEFSDGTRKGVRYGFSQPPPEIAVLLKKMNAIQEKCPSQMVYMPAPYPVSTERNAKPISVVEAVYPEVARIAEVKGAVAVYLVIGKTGEVETVTAADGPEELQQAAIDAVKQWKWKPYLVNRVAIRFRTKAVLHFAAEATSGETK
ncbi:MAG TPA: energy transducer TonB [Candidatus Sulfotelmatobacter sp.]|nr:energy transducer TonB [Candidatus Sulfotelmatobacter sp.]